MYDTSHLIFSIGAFCVSMYSARKLWRFAFPPQYVYINLGGLHDIHIVSMVTYVHGLNADKFLNMNGDVYYIEDHSSPIWKLRRLSRKERIVHDVMRA